MFNLQSVKTQLIIFLLCFAFFIGIERQDFSFLNFVGISTLACAIIDSFLNFFKTKKFQLGESSLITGLIIGFVLSSDQSLNLVIAVAALAIFSKHLIRFNKRHIFNPAGFGILAAVFLFKAKTAWVGTYEWQILLPAGLYFAFRIKKLELLASYFVVALGIFAVQALWQGTPLSNIFGYLSYFYILIMLIEPKTTPFSLLGKISFGADAAILIFALTQIGVRFDAELAALLIANISVPVLNKIKIGGRL